MFDIRSALHCTFCLSGPLLELLAWKSSDSGLLAFDCPDEEFIINDLLLLYDLL
jgi:hypothetical protein